MCDVLVEHEKIKHFLSMLCSLLTNRKILNMVCLSLGIADPPTSQAPNRYVIFPAPKGSFHQFSGVISRSLGNV